MRRRLFGDAQLGILYSGTVGQAHDISPFIELARECRRRNFSVGFCFAGYGNRYTEQTVKITPEDTNVTLAGFASEEELVARLATADFHMISLREGWEGIVVPSKFFGALAMGRPVLFSGPETSEINGWIQQYRLGYRLAADSPVTLEYFLNHPVKLAELKQHVLDTYQVHFSRQAVVKTWMENL